jgi:hypothetical protein
VLQGNRLLENRFIKVLPIDDRGIGKLNPDIADGRVE